MAEDLIDHNPYPGQPAGLEGHNWAAAMVRRAFPDLRFTADVVASDGQFVAGRWTMTGTNTRFAVKPKTGEIVWRHQVLPRDNWDQECTFEMMVINSPDNRPLTVGLAMFTLGAEGAQAWGVSAAGTLLVVAPLLVGFVLFQRRFVNSFLASGLK